MNFMNKLEKKLGRFAIPNLSIYIIICYAFGYLLQMVNPAFLHYLSLNPFCILRGQVWRLFTWVLIPPNSSNLFYVIIFCLFCYSISRTLEQTWGTFYYNVYIFGGLLITTLSSFIMAGILCLNVDFGAINTTLYANFLGKDSISTMGVLAYYFEEMYPVFTYSYSTYYIFMSIFLAFSTTYPDMQVLLMFILPIRVKWLGIAYAAILGYEMINGFVHGAWYISFAILASLVNFFVFFFFIRKRKPHRTSAQAKAARAFHRATSGQTSQGENPHMGAGAYSGYARTTGGSGPITRHKCAVCGRSEKDDSSLEFRFCSKCEGNYEYCQYHLFSHTHVKHN